MVVPRPLCYLFSFQLVLFSTTETEMLFPMWLSLSPQKREH